jgi:hypothetical protein
VEPEAGAGSVRGVFNAAASHGSGARDI